MPYETRTNRDKPNYLDQAAEILEGICEGFFALDRDWRFIYVNERAAGNLGLKPQDLIGQNLWEKLPQVIGTEHEVNYRKAMTERQPQEFEWHSVLTHKWYNIRVSPSKEGVSVYWHDFTEYKQIEESLKETQELCRVGNWEYDLETQTISWSAETYILYERDPKLGPPSEEEDARYYSPKQYTALRDYVTRSIESGQIFSYDLKVRLPSRKPAYYHASIHPLKNAQGRVIKLFGTVQDIAERKQVEAALKESEKQYHGLFTSMNEGFAILEMVLNKQREPVDFTIVDANPAWEKLTGMRFEKVKGKRATEILPVVEPEWFELYKKIMASDEPQRFEGYRPVFNRWLDIIAYPVWGKNRIAVIFSDITKRKQSEESLRESEDLHRAIFNHSIDAIIVSSGDGTIYSANEAALRMFRVTLEEFKRGGRDLVIDKSDPRLIPALEQRARTGWFRGEINFKRKDGTIFPSEVSSLLFTSKEGQPRAVLIIRDITEHKRIDEALAKAKDDLEIQVKERIHELRECEEKYRSLVDNASEAIAVVQDGHIKFMNKQGVKPTGYLSEDMVDKPFLDFVHPDDRKAVEKEVRRHVEGQPVTSNYEFRFVAKDGIVRWAIMNAVNILWEGKPAILAIITDITERKQAEEKILQMFRYRVLLTEISTNFINVPLEHLNKEITDAQRRICEYLDLDISSIYQSSPETAPSLKLAHLYRRLEGPPVPKTLIAREHFPWCEQQLVSGKEAVAVPSTRDLPAEAARDQASWQYYGIKSSLMFPLLAQGGEVIGTLSFDSVRKECPWPEDLVGGLKLAAQVFANAIARKQFEEALEESENKANALIKYAPAAIYELDVRGLRFIHVNDAMSVITGYTREELLAMNPNDLLDENSRKLFAERIKRILDRKRIEKEVEYKARRKDGTIIDVSLQTTLSPKDSNILFVVGHDITERKKMEEALKTYAWRITQVQEDERRRIGYELHDDTAQYLGILKMQLDALLHSGKVQNPEVTEKLKYLEKDADMAFNDVRRYSHELRPVTLERSGLTAALEQIAEDHNKLGQLPVIIKVGGKEPQLSEEVKLGFFRIAQEALNNARKHAKARQATIIISFLENRLKMSVRDDGIGFDAREAAARASGKGSLGLISMRERADLIGARLKIGSKPGAGTIISVEKSL